jgi:exodeoxyribonuclease VII small subunit
MADRSAPACASPVPEELPFEVAVERLEAVVDRLERGELSLEEALVLFEQGVRLSRRLGEQLEQAKRRVELLLEQEGELLARPFEEAEEPP